MGNERKLPTIEELVEDKVQMKFWAPPVVRDRLNQMARAAGKSTSKLTTTILSGAAFPELAGEPVLKFAWPEEPERGDGEDAPRFDSREQFKAYLLVEGIVSCAADAEAVVNLAVEFLNKPAAGGSLIWPRSC